MKGARVRTTSFRLKPEHFGQVYLYRAGDRFHDAWRRIVDACPARGLKRPPYSGLVTALRVLSRDFVAMWPSQHEHCLFASRRQLDPDLIAAAFRAWEFAIWPETAKGILASAAGDLIEEQVNVWDAVERRPGKCPRVAARWVWDVATWEVAHRLAATPLMLDAGLTAQLRLDTDAGLVTWDNLVSRHGRHNLLSAMHRIAPKLITLPGLEDPVIHLDSSLSRLADRWAGVRTSWVDRGVDQPLLLVDVRHQRVGEEWRAAYADLSTEVLARLELAHLPKPEEVDLASSDQVRARLAKPPARYRIGTGTGQMFHEAVALHMRSQVPDAEPVELVRAVRCFARPNSEPLKHQDVEHALTTTDGNHLRIVALYATDETRKRMVDALAPVLPKRNVYADEKVYTRAGLSVVFVSPSDAKQFLSQNGSAQQTRDWIAPISKRWRGDGLTAALIETTTTEDREAAGDDPKWVLRRALAAVGIASQFISPSSVPNARRAGDEEPVDHAAVRSLWDLLRSSGVFTRAFPTVAGVPVGTWVVGVYVVRRNGGGTPNRGFVPSVVAVEAGGHRALGLTAEGKWVPLGAANTAFHTIDHDLEWKAVSPFIDAGLTQLVAASPHQNVIVFIDANECRRFWSGLADTGENGLPLVANSGRAAIIRVRAEGNEVPRPAGLGPWPQGPGPGRPRTVNALVRLATEDYPGARFYVNTPRNMSVMGAHRSHTRFSAVAAREQTLADNWQALNMTEFLCVKSGPYEVNTLYELASMLCRQAPTWDGTLDSPAPCHLARAVVEDHPGRYLVEATATKRVPSLAAPSQHAEILDPNVP